MATPLLLQSQTSRGTRESATLRPGGATFKGVETPLNQSSIASETRKTGAMGRETGAMERQE